ncbi:hypothetical protein V8D89_016289 [Ganoderma adspersum]
MSWKPYLVPVVHTTPKSKPRSQVLDFDDPRSHCLSSTAPICSLDLVNIPPDPIFATKRTHSNAQRHLAGGTPTLFNRLERPLTAVLAGPSDPTSAEPEGQHKKGAWFPSSPATHGCSSMLLATTYQTSRTVPFNLPLDPVLRRLLAATLTYAREGLPQYHRDYGHKCPGDHDFHSCTSTSPKQIDVHVLGEGDVQDRALGLGSKGPFESRSENRPSKTLIKLTMLREKGISSDHIPCMRRTVDEILLLADLDPRTL